MRVDESLFFANMPAVLGRIEEKIDRQGDTRHLVLDLSPSATSTLRPSKHSSASRLTCASAV
jgi:hypothetical protein